MQDYLTENLPYGWVDAGDLINNVCCQYRKRVTYEQLTGKSWREGNKRSKVSNEAARE
jgi:hypothetical protein